MKTVLMIFPQFSASSAPQVHRGRWLAKHLPSFGWNPVILTVSSEFVEEQADPDLVRSLPPDTEIIRTQALPQRWTRRIGIGDLGIRAYSYLLDRAKKLCQSRKIDLIFISSPPWHTFLIGPKIKKDFRVPFVLDYTDPWVSSMGKGAAWWKKSFWFRLMARLLEPGAVRHADHILSVSDGTSREILERYAGQRLPPFSTIPFAADPDDMTFAKKRPSEFRFKENGYFHFVYTGAMLPKGYDTVRALFQAVREIRSEHPDIYERMRLHFIGTTYAVRNTPPLVTPVAEEMGVGGVVREHPKRLSYFDSLRILCEADCLLALGTTETHYTASKIFPYILADRPLLAVYHEASSVVQVMRECGAGETVVYSDEQPVQTKIQEIKKMLLLTMDAAYQKPVTDFKKLEKYSANNMTRQISAIFDQAAAYGN